MTRVSVPLTSFAGGEISKYGLMRVELPLYSTYAERMRNVVLAPLGGFMRRPGTRYVADTKETVNKVRLADFQFSTDQSYILEVGDGYMRFYADQGQLVDGAAAVEVATPYTGNFDPFLLDWAQAADVMYFAHPDYPPHKLTRISNTNWTFEPVNFLNGPFLAENVDDNIRIQSNALQGNNVTLTATGGFTFDPGLVGSVIRLSADGGFLNTKLWEPNEAGVNFGARRQSNQKIYQSRSAGANTSGEIAPAHIRGTQNDGINATGIDWRFLNDGHGYALITAVAGATATVDIPADVRLPASVQSDGTTFWAEASWSQLRGYPSHVTFADQRAVWAGTRHQPSTFWMSAAGDFENFQGPGLSQETEDDDPIDRTLDNSEGSVNTIQWISFKDRLFFGTDGGVFSVQTSDGSGFTPRNITATHVNSTRCSRVPAVIASSSILFLQRANRRLHELIFSFEDERFDSPDLTYLAESILNRGAVEMAWQDQPNKTLWAIDETGQMRSMLFDRTEGAIGWCRHDIRDSTVESIATIPGSGLTEDRDEVWAVVRNANGRYICLIERDWRSDKHQISDAYYLDLMATANNPTGATLGGLLRLAGQEVAIWGDGVERPRQNVSAAGEISLLGLTGLSTLQIGLPIDWQYFGHKLNHGGLDGFSIPKRRRIAQAGISLIDATDFKIGDNLKRMNSIYDLVDQDINVRGDLLEGDYLLPLESGYDGKRDPRVFMTSAGSGPVHVRGIAPIMKTAGS